MTVRTELLVELFGRCRTERPDIEWIEGWPGDNPPREHVWLSDIDGGLVYPTSKAATAADPLTVQDDATITLSAISATGGQSRTAAMANVEGYLTVAVRILAGDPDLGAAVPGTLSISPRQMRGPYSFPNTVDVGGFAATAELDLGFVSRPD